MSGNIDRNTGKLATSYNPIEIGFFDPKLKRCLTCPIETPKCKKKFTRI